MNSEWLGRFFWLALGIVAGFIGNSQFSKRSEAVAAAKVAAPITATSPSKLPVAHPAEQAKPSAVAQPTAPGETSTNSVLNELATAMDAGDGAKALAILEEGLKKHGEKPEILNELAGFYARQMGDDAKALGYLERALQADPTNLRSLEELTDLAGSPKDARSMAQAKKLLEQVVEKNPNSLPAQTAMAEYLARSKQLPEAAQAYERAAQLPGASAQTRFRAADVYYELNQPHKATAHFSALLKDRERANRDNPNDVNARLLELARVDHARALMREGKASEAQTILQPMMQAQPDNLMLQQLATELRSAIH